MSNASSACGHRGPGSFDPASMSWTSYSGLLNTYIQIANLTTDESKKLFLLQQIGSKVLHQLTVALNGQNAMDKTFEELCYTLKGIYDPPAMLAPIRHKIFSCRRKASQTSAEFIMEILSLSMKADLDSITNPREFVQVQAIIAGVRDDKTRARLLEEENPSLERIRALVRTSEQARSAAQAMKPDSEHQGVVSYVDRRKPKKAFQVGKQNGNQRRCYNCGSTEHLVSNCPKKKGQGNHRQGGSRQNGRNQRRFNKKERINDTEWVDPDGDSDSDPPLHLLHMHVDEVDLHAVCPPTMLAVQINGQNFEMELDSGAAVLVIPEGVWDNVGKPQLTPTLGRLKAYGGTPLPLKGSCTVEMKFEGQTTCAKLVVLEGDGHLLFGRDLIRQFKLDMGPYFVHQVVPPMPAFGLTVDQIKEKFAVLFDDSLGTYKGPDVELKFKKPPTPVFFRSRQIPFALRDKVDQELDKLEKSSEWKKVRHTDFASPLVIVPKPGDEIRLCVDFKRTINPQLDVDEHPIPTVESVFQSLNGGKTFSKIDLKAAFTQLKLSPDSQKICTVSTPRGLYQCTRLPFGIASAPAIFQSTIEKILQGIPNVAVCLDDITVTGQDDNKHAENLFAVLTRLQNAGLKVKASKCQFFEPKIMLLGHILTSEGIKAIPEKVEAIRKMPAPRNIKELSVLGMIQYYTKFVKGLSSVAAPLNKLRKKACQWEWGSEQQFAFQELKKLLTSSEVLVHYNPQLPVRLSTDASDYGIGAQLEHIFPNGNIKVIGYASRTLTPAERNYSQIEKEGLGIIYGVTKFNQYLYGRRFTLLTDHQPLVRIFGPKMGLPTVAARRLQRWATFLMSYSFDIEYVPTDKFGNADGLSRLPNPDEKPDRATKVEDLTVNAVQDVIQYPIGLGQVRKATEKDKIMYSGQEIRTDGLARQMPF
ncbi:unnamed protein product [Bursaphelenchus okinawaensis]|uniref:Reverse transcriptase n=1 Tax=Bursaphelenchus okinawaensis TaxID=465554 RepID=A0A811JSV1_9BILA|nr:unnamed protein product [Bursaphelenchus okinawaensis]CAG9080943.1 unnamed protein product [Bursaphelenchus okinawaensis]